MIFTLTIDSRNAVFTGGGRSEVARILRDVATGVEQGSEGHILVESNGNKCGQYDCDDEKPEFFELEASDLFEQADNFAIALDDDPRKLPRAELIEGLESIGVACYDEESDLLLAEAYGDSMMCGDLGGIDRTAWPDALQEAWDQ